VLVAAGFAMWGKYPGINWRVMLAVVVLGSSYNALLRRSLLRDGTGPVAAVSQALIDMLMLTVVLWSAGGIRNPFMGFYIFHVALIAVLGGPRATLVAAAAAFGMAGLLALTLLEPRLQIGVWDPQPAWDTFAHVAAFVVTLTAASYVVSHAAREVRDREEALKRARDRAALVPGHVQHAGRAGRGARGGGPRRKPGVAQPARRGAERGGGHWRRVELPTQPRLSAREQ
jgi:hypothetical protein